jgi:hypothetical protein
MTTSGTYTFSQNRDAIIARAARLVSAIAAGETPDAGTVSDFSDALNAMVRHWQTLGISIWCMAEGILFPQLGQVRYTLGSGSTDHATESFAETTISAAEASGQTTISLTSTASIAAADQIGIQLDDGTMHWSTVTSKTSTTVLIPDALADSAAAGNLVVTYTASLVRPLKIVSARHYNFASAIDTPLVMFDRIEYQELPLKTNEATATGYFYDRRGGANSTGYLYLWPAPTAVDEAVKFSFSRPIQDFSTAANTADFPDEWYQALAFGLAETMGPEYDLPEIRQARLEKKAAQYLNDASWWERELTDVQFMPERR